MEKLDISELIEDLMQDEDFKESSDDESVEWTLCMMLRDYSESLKWNNFPTGDQYKFEFEEAYSEKGDGKDEETIYGIFKRKSDDKFFKIWVHDSGFIESPSLCDSMDEVRAKEETRKIKTWDKF